MLVARLDLLPERGDDLRLALQLLTQPTRRRQARVRARNLRLQGGDLLLQPRLQLLLLCKSERR